MKQLEEQLKQQIIEALNLEEITTEDIDSEAPLFGEGLGLDSIDALEIILILDREYGIKISDPKSMKPHFASINKLAEFVDSNRSK